MSPRATARWPERKIYGPARESSIFRAPSDLSQICQGFSVGHKQTSRPLCSASLGLLCTSVLALVRLVSGWKSRSRRKPSERNCFSLTALPKDPGEPVGQVCCFLLPPGGRWEQCRLPRPCLSLWSSPEEQAESALTLVLTGWLAEHFFPV